MRGGEWIRIRSFHCICKLRKGTTNIRSFPHQISHDVPVKLKRGIIFSINDTHSSSSSTSFSSPTRSITDGREMGVDVHSAGAEDEICVMRFYGRRLSPGKAPMTSLPVYMAFPV